MATITGSHGDDKITGTSNDDDLKGNGGNDVINGGKGNDNIKGGTGKDKLYGGDVTCDKVGKLKARRNATKRDVQLANWFINMQDCKK